MEVRNKVGSDRSDLYRGSGQLGSTLDYLMYNDPSTYYYQKLRSANNQYLRDDYWSEAARRGETDQLLAALLSWENLDTNLRTAQDKLNSFTSTGDETKDNETKQKLQADIDKYSSLSKDTDYLSRVQDYANKGYDDYNAYMLAITLPLFDDTEKKARTDEVSGYNFGSYTDKEWAEKVLDSMFERYDVQIAEAEKENMNWFQKVGATIGSGLLSFVGGVVNFFGDVVNLGEGILNCFFNFSDDATWNDRFLWAFSDESTGFFEQAGDLFNDMAYKVAYESTDMVNMVDAYDAGYRPASWEGMIFGTDRSQGVGASYRTWGKWWSGAFSSIGYMLPSMVISAGVSAIPGGAAIAGKVGTSVFYSGIFSGNIKDTVSAAANEGLSYKDLNAGEVVSNGLIKAGLQWAVEVALGKILGFSGLDQAIGIGRGAGKFGNLVGGMGGKLGAIGITALRAGRSMAKEGLEEVLQDMSDSFVDAIYGTTNSKIADLYSSRALETINPMNLLESFVVGALTEGVISSLQGVKYILPKNRAVQTDIDGNVQAMGFFQTLNFNAALETMNDWNNILSDSKATAEAKADAAMKMSAAINTIGSVLKSFGQSDALKVNQILDIYAAGEKKTELLEKANLSNEQYATKLYDSFLMHYAEVERKYVPKPLKTKIKETFAKLADKFKKKGVTEVENIITNKIDGNDPDVPLKSNNVENFKVALEKLGAEAIIGTDGNIITKSEDIVIVPNKLLETGDLATVIQGIAFDQVQQAVISALSPAQRKMIVRQYEKATGTTCTTEQAVQALLFDKAFYTRILLASEEGHKYNVEALQVLATINKVVQAKASPLLKNGKLTNDVYNVLMQKIQKTMQTGLVTYCTKYARIDLGEITNDILSPELKEVIKNHQNTIFSEFVDEGIKDTKTQAPDSERTTRFDTYLQKFSSSLSAEEITELKQKARSTNVNDRVDAYTMLTVLSRNSTSPNATKDKLVYLPTSPDGIIEREYLQNVEKFFGLTWAELISGNYDASKITQEGRNFIQAQYDMSDRASRLACIRDALFNISGGTLTVGMDGSILEIMEKDKFVKDKYLGKEGTKAFRDDLRKGVIKTVADVVKVDLKNSTIKNMKLVRSDTLNGAKGAFVYGDDHISFSAGADVNTFMHELTHVTQYALDVTGQSATGGYAGMFKYMTPEAAKSLDNYIAEKFPLTYNYMVNHKISTYNTIYFMLAGELQANSTLGTHMFDVGFTFDKAGTVLVSPDGKERWNLKANQSDAQKQFRRNVAKARRELSKEIKNQQQANTTENTQTTKATTEAKTETKAASQLDERTTKALDEVVNKNVKKATRATINQVNNATLYKGMNVSKVTEFDNTKGNKKRIVSNAIWLTDNKNVAESYANNKRASATVYDSKVSISNPLVIDAKGQAFSSIMGNITSDQIAVYAQEHGYDSLIIKNVLDIGPYLGNVTNRENSMKPSTDVVIFDKTKAKITNETKYSEDRDLKLAKNWRNQNKMNQEQLNKYNRDRYITNKEARESNLKYYIQKGVPIRMHPGVAAFVEATTSDFTKLPTILQNKIMSGQLLYSDILDYINTAANMDDYTFRAIAKYVFNNDRLAKLDVKTLLKLEDYLHEFAIAAYLTTEPDKYLTPKQMIETYKEVTANADPDKLDFAKKFTENIVRTDKGGHNRYIEATPQANQLNESFFKHYDGTLAGMREINNLAKAITNVYDTHQVARENQKTATVDYDYSTAVIIEKNDDISKTLDSIDKVEKINALETYYTDVATKRLQEQMKTEGIRPDKDTVIALRRKIDSMVDALYSLSDVELNAKYLEVLNQNSQQKKSMSAVTTPVQRTPYEQQENSMKNVKDNLRGVGRTMTRWISSMNEDAERFYNRLPADIKKWFDPNNRYKLVSDYRNLSKQEIVDLTRKIQKARDQMRHWVKSEEATKVALAKSQERLAKLQKQYKQYREQVDKKQENKTLRQKIQVEHVVHIEGANVTSSSPSNRVVEEILKTSWNKKRMGEVQELDNNIEHAVANANTFFKENANTLLSASTAELEEAIAFFANNTTKLTEDEFARFNALRTYFFGWVLEADKNGQITLNANLKQQVNNIMRNMASNYGTGLAVWNNIRQRLNPLDSMRSQDIEVGGITLNDDLKDKLFDAIESNDVDVMTKTYEEITEWLDEQQSSKKGVLRRIVGVRSMAMLSSPLTWLRNKMSNFMLKRLNTLSSKIGNAMFKGKTMAGQLKMNQQVTPEIQKFITDNIIDNGFFDTFVSNLSKFNVSDIVAKNQNKIAKGETLTREEITTHLVLKAIYNEYYNNNMFKSKLLNDLHKNLMKVMSDDSYVREAAVRYFGKILAEKKYSLKDGKMTDAIMNDFSTAIGLALNDYMHSDNFFNNVERWLSDRSELGWFAYKLIMPYAASSWNWFKAAIRYSPIGLGRAIYRITHLEQQVAKAEADYIAGKSNVSPELTEYLIRRDLGSGVIGTVAMGLGALLAGLGFMRLEDDDYGKPKLHIGNLVIDVSDIFGSSSVLAGAAFVTGIQEKGWTWEGVLDALNRLADVTIDDLPVMDIVQMDMYSNGSFDMGLNQLESIALSFIPNILSWFAGLTYTGTLNKQTFLDRALAKIPFAARLVEKKVDPYTGKTDSWADWVGRAVPYFSWDAASQNERKTTALGLTKTMLRGQYKVNGEDFNVTGKDLTEINKTYGTLNAEDLTKFYENKLVVSVKQENGKYKTMTYNQMTTKQRQNAVSSIMQNNADLVKIIAWLKAGNKYYASSTIYNKLVKLGITENLYRGSKGFVKG